MLKSMSDLGESVAIAFERLIESGLLAMQEADLNIKRSRIKPEYALEVLIVKLCSKEVC